MEQLYPTLTPEERYERLQANAYNTEEELVKRDFTPEQMEEMRCDFATESIILGDLKEEKSQIVKNLNGKIKEKESKVKPLLKNIRKGYAESKETVFAMDDQENNLMNVYDADGMFLYSRTLKPAERQTKIHSLMAKQG